MRRIGGNFVLDAHDKVIRIVHVKVVFRRKAERYLLFGKVTDKLLLQVSFDRSAADDTVVFVVDGLTVHQDLSGERQPSQIEIFQFLQGTSGTQKNDDSVVLQHPQCLDRAVRYLSRSVGEQRAVEIQKESSDHVSTSLYNKSQPRFSGYPL